MLFRFSKRGLFIFLLLKSYYTCLSILLATLNYRARGTFGPSTLNYSLNQNALKHGRRTFVCSAMGELVCRGQLWARAALRQLRSYKVG